MLCPVCGGDGEVYRLPRQFCYTWNQNNNLTIGIEPAGEKLYEWIICNGCNGKGWVEVREE